MTIDVRKDGDRFTVHSDLPGVKAKDIRATADNGTLTIRGKRRFEKKEVRRASRSWSASRAASCAASRCRTTCARTRSGPATTTAYEKS
jgi:HSP20 family molecular chaperone IbpA